MTQNKTTKRALLTSALSLLLCCTMLIGTTWAWFTDSVTSSGNKIQSGTLQIDLLVKGGNTGKTEYKSVKDGELVNKPIFNYELWEPGYTLVTYAKVINKGNLALKYTLNFTSESNIAAAELAKVIDVYYAPLEVAGITERTDLTTAVENDTLRHLGTLQDVFAGGGALAVNDHLDPNGVGNYEDCATIVLKMQETAGNQYQGKTIPAFDIQLLATQWTYESDSFDNLYDDGLTPAIDGTVVEKDGIQYVYTDDGKIVLYKVTEDYEGSTVNVPEGVTNIGDWAFAYNNNIENVVLSSTVRDLGRGFDSSAVKSVTLNEGLEKISPKAFRRTPNLESIIIPSTVKEIEPDAFQSSGLKEIYIPANVEKIGNRAFVDCNDMEKITIAGDDVVIGTYVARPCLALREVYILGENVTFEPGSMTFTNYETGKASDITFYVQNETVKDRLIAASGSSVSYGLNIKLPATVSVGGNSYVVTEAFKDSLGTAWDDGALGANDKITVTVSSPDDLAVLSKMTNVSGWVGGDSAYMLTIDITDDLDFSGVAWTPIGPRASVTIKGNNHVISNLSNALVSYGGYTFINDLTLENVSASGSQIGAFAAAAEGLNLTNCTLAGNVNITYSATTETWRAIGALVGWNSGVTFNNVNIADNTVINLDATGIKDGHADTSLLTYDTYVGTGTYTGVTVGSNVTVNYIHD